MWKYVHVRCKCERFDNWTVKWPLYPFIILILNILLIRISAFQYSLTDLERAARLSMTFVHAKRVTPNTHRMMLIHFSPSQFNTLYMTIRSGSLSFASIRILRQFNSNPNTDSQKSHHNRKTTFYIQGTKRRRGCWLFFLFILFAQICLCVEFCVFRLKIGATALEHLCIAYHRAKKSLYTQKALVITSRIVLRHIFMTEQT